jgi:hypothetical protein
MKRYTLFSLVGILLILFLAACAGSSSEVSTTEAEGDADAQSGVDNEMDIEITDVNQLIVGTMMLAETDHPVTPEQAQSLLPLWQLYQTMIGADTTASEELDAVIKQIQKVLTEEQLAEIASVEFNDPIEMMDSLGIEPSQMSGMQSVDDLPEDIRDKMGDGNVIVIEGGFVGAGEMPSGSIEGGLEGSDLGELDPEQLAELRGQVGDGSSLHIRMFLPALIEYLEEVAGS